MSTRNAAPSDLKDPEVTQQNLPKGETWDGNEYGSYLCSRLGIMMADH
jgi:hypothetical protein